MLKTKVAVLMATYNGAKYINEQIRSIEEQEGVIVDLFVRDDGSSDETIKILQKYQDKGVLRWYAGDRLKSAYSFFNLLENAPDADYYAFCDQDDVWDQDKLKVAILKLNDSRSRYSIYCCGTRLVDERVAQISVHNLDVRRTLHSRLFFAYVSGNTIVMNKALRDKIIEKKPENIVMHDAWCFKVALCLGADVLIDSSPHISYRQHANNVVGMEMTIMGKISKFFYIIKEKNSYKQLMEIQRLYSNEITDEYERIMKLASQCKKSVKARCLLAYKSDVNFNNFFMTTAFRIKVLLNMF